MTLLRAALVADAGGTGTLCNDGDEHKWQPVSFAFEDEARGVVGQVVYRAPDMFEARVYLLCLGCRCWTYVITEFAGYCLGGSGTGEAGDVPLGDGEQRARRHTTNLRRLAAIRRGANR